MQDTTWIDKDRVQLAVKVADTFLDALDVGALDFVPASMRQNPDTLLEQDDFIWQTLQEQMDASLSTRTRALVVAVLRCAQAR